VNGPDVWEVIAAFKDLPSSGDAAIQEIATEFTLSPAKVRSALAYYGAYAAEIDQEIADNEFAAENAYQSWLNQQRILV